VSAIVVVIVTAAGLARADTRAELQAHGEELGRAGRWTEAIKSFKAAERLEHRAIHACLIALAYTRKEAWPQAELFLAACHEPFGETLPDWVPDADRQIAERLRDANLTEVTIEVRPPGTPTTLTVSSFAPDEVFAPRTIHLPHGTHVIVGHAQGFPDQEQVVVIDSATPRHVVIDLLAKPRAVASARRTVARPLLLAGAIALGASAVSYGIMGYEWNQLRHASSGPEFDQHDGLYKTTRATMIAFGAIGAGLVVTGLILRRGAEHGATLTLAPTDGGAFVGIGWQR
jgi:hypothetical protein